MEGAIAFSPIDFNAILSKLYFSATDYLLIYLSLSLHASSGNSM